MRWVIACRRKRDRLESLRGDAAAALTAAVGIIEREPLVVSAVGAILDRTEDLRLGAIWPDLLTAYEAWATSPPEVVVVNASLLGVDPLASLDAIRDSTSVTAIVRTRYFNVDHVHLLFHGGAAGVLPSSAQPEELVDALRAVRAGGRYVPRQVQDEVHARLVARRPHPYVTLTTRQREILALAACGASGPDIAELLSLSEATVRSHLRIAYGKLGVSGRAEALVVVPSDLLNAGDGCSAVGG